LVLTLAVGVACVGCAEHGAGAKPNPMIAEAAAACVATPGSEGLTPPKVIRRIQPAAPRGEQHRGFAAVCATIDETGRPTDLRVARTDNEEFAQTYMATLAGWQFEPARQNGKPIAFTMVFSASFDKHDPSSPAERRELPPLPGADSPQ
jgi:TonB family protein